MAFKVGDTGKTRNGSEYTITGTNGTRFHLQSPQPIIATVVTRGVVHREQYFSEDGRYCAGDSDWDMIQPTNTSAVTVAIDAYQQACTDFEREQALLFVQELAVEKAKAAVQDARLNLRDALDGEA